MCVFELYIWIWTSCLENPRDRGAWWAAVYWVAQSRTRLKWLSSSRIKKAVFLFLCFFSSSRMRTLPHPHLQPPQHPAWGFEESCFVGKNKGIFLHTCRLRKWYQSERNEDCYPGLLSQSQWQKRQNKSPIFHPPPKLYQLLKLRLPII